MTYEQFAARYCGLELVDRHGRVLTKWQAFLEGHYATRTKPGWLGGALIDVAAYGHYFSTVKFTAP